MIDLSTGRPGVVVLPDGGAFVVVAAGPASFGSRAGWYVAYVAGVDPRGTEAPGATQQRVVAADALFRSQQVVAELAGAELFSVFALYGASGERGVVRALTYVQGPDGWSRSAASLAGEVSSMPPLPERFERDPAAESSAVEVARRFLAHCDRGELDAAWSLSSTAMKATTSRAEFDEQLHAAACVDAPRTRREVFHGFGMTPFTPGAELDVLLERAGSYDAVQVRLDEDLAWRVERVRGFAVDPAGASARGVEL